MSKICKILPERCIACGLCAIHSPKFFDYNQEGIVCFFKNSKALHQFIPDKEYLKVLKAYKNCPSHAIILEN